MRPLIFLFPHDRMDVGGNSAQARFVEACGRFTGVDVAFYGDRVPGRRHIDDYLASPGRAGDGPIFVIHWGPDIAMLLDRLAGRDVAYVAHSTGWGMSLDPRVPILCVSRNTMAYWGRHAPNSYIAHVPNIVTMEPASNGIARDIDVLVQVRKSSPYLLDRLVPALRHHCRVTVLDGWVDDLSAWFRRSKVYLYDSLEHWLDVGASEGFGLPPLEAMGHGCTVFSSVNDALSDYLDPGFNCRKIRVHSLSWDVAEILRAVEEAAPVRIDDALLAQFGAEHVSKSLEVVFGDLCRFFAHAARAPSDIEDPWAERRPTAVQRARQAVKLLAGR